MTDVKLHWTQMDKNKGRLRRIAKRAAATRALNRAEARVTAPPVARMAAGRAPARERERELREIVALAFARLPLDEQLAAVRQAYR